MSGFGYVGAMTATTKLPVGTRVRYIGTEKFGTVLPGIAPHASQVIVQMDDFADLGTTHILFRDTLEMVCTDATSFA